MSIWMWIAILTVVVTILYFVFGFILHGLGVMMGDAQGKSVPRNVGPGPNQSEPTL